MLRLSQSPSDAAEAKRATRCKWHKWFALLVEFKLRFGHCEVSYDWKENPALGRWLSKARGAARAGRLSSECQQALERLGVKFQRRTRERPDCAQKWAKMFDQLVAFKLRFGHCNVPFSWPENPQLGAWLRNRRKERGRLAASRIAMLERLGVRLPGKRITWDDHFAALLRFKEQHGTVQIPRVTPEYRRLATWLDNQRDRWRHGQLLPKQVEQLQRAGAL